MRTKPKTSQTLSLLPNLIYPVSAAADDATRRLLWQVSRESRAAVRVANKQLKEQTDRGLHIDDLKHMLIPQTDQSSRSLWHGVAAANLPVRRQVENNNDNNNNNALAVNHSLPWSWDQLINLKIKDARGAIHHVALNHGYYNCYSMLVDGHSVPYAARRREGFQQAEILHILRVMFPRGKTLRMIRQTYTEGLHRVLRFDYAGGERLAKERVYRQLLHPSRIREQQSDMLWTVDNINLNGSLDQPASQAFQNMTTALAKPVKPVNWSLFPFRRNNRFVGSSNNNSNALNSASNNGSPSWPSWE